MVSLFLLIDTILAIYQWVLIIVAILSWLIAFNVINPHNQFVTAVYDMLLRLTEPVLRVIRRYIPRVGGLDLSALVLILAVMFIRSLLREYGPL